MQRRTEVMAAVTPHLLFPLCFYFVNCSKWDIFDSRIIVSIIKTPTGVLISRQSKKLSLGLTE